MRATPLLLALAFATPVLAKDYDDVASLLEAVRSGQQKTNRYVRIKRAVVTTDAVAWDYDGPKPYTTWFYVNDAGRDGDGLLISLPNYYSGTNPFDDDDDNPWESEIAIPALKRGQALEISGRLESRDDDSGGFALVRSDLDDVELVPDAPEEESHSGSLEAELKLLEKVSLPAPKAPAGVALSESSLRAGEVVVISGQELGDRAKVTLDGKRVAIAERRPGLLLARIPADAAPGAHALRVENPAGKSAPLTVTVLAPEPPPAPRLEAARLSGKLLTLRGSGLRGEGLEVYLGSARLERVLVASAGQIVAEVPAGVSGAARVKVAGRESNAVAVTPASTGFTGSVPGQ